MPPRPGDGERSSHAGSFVTRLKPEDLQAFDAAILDLQAEMRQRVDRSEVVRALVSRFVKDPELRQEVSAELTAMRRSPGIDLGL
ncbi:MAG: hypothetical protein M3Q38_02970 [Chloroflexota bacterium]|nr:hypothetical protein [Chloroflexota bacterium]